MHKWGSDTLKDSQNIISSFFLNFVYEKLSLIIIFWAQVLCIKVILIETSF